MGANFKHKLWDIKLLVPHNIFKITNIVDILHLFFSQLYHYQRSWKNSLKVFTDSGFYVSTLQLHIGNYPKSAIRGVCASNRASTTTSQLKNQLVFVNHFI